MQGHGSTCDCTFSVLFHIALCMCIVFFVCRLGGAFCFASCSTLVCKKILSGKKGEGLVRKGGLEYKVRVFFSTKRGVVLVQKGRIFSTKRGVFKHNEGGFSVQNGWFFLV